MERRTFKARVWLWRIWLAHQLSRLVAWLNPQAIAAQESALDALAAEIHALRAEKDDLSTQFGALTNRYTDLRERFQNMEASRDGFERELVAVKAKYANCLPFERDALFARAVELTSQWDVHNTSGEFKRHQVLASLMDDFPGRPRRDLALAIEAAIWQ